MHPCPGIAPRSRTGLTHLRHLRFSVSQSRRSGRSGRLKPLAILLMHRISDFDQSLLDGIEILVHASGKDLTRRHVIQLRAKSPREALRLIGKVHMITSANAMKRRVECVNTISDRARKTIVQDHKLRDAPRPHPAREHLTLRPHELS